MRIAGVHIEDFKRISVVDVEFGPDDSLLVVGGENGHGKSSFLDAIESALGDLSRSISEPVRHGADRSLVRVSIPPYMVERTVKDGRNVLKVVRTDDRSELKAPGQFLKRLTGEGFCDPVRFLIKSPADKRKELLELVGVDVDAYDKEASDLRRLADQCVVDQDALFARLGEIEIPDDTPDEPIDVEQILAKLRSAEVANRDAQAFDLEAQSLQNELDDARLEVQKAQQRVEDLHLKIAGRTRLERPVPVDTAPIQEQLASTGTVNNNVRLKKERLAAEAKWDELDGQKKAYDAAVREAQENKKKALEAAPFPVPGLGFGDGDITLGGVPFDQAGHAEQVTAALGISLARRGQLAVVFIHEGGALDNHTLHMIAEQAQAAGALVIVAMATNRQGDDWDKQCDLYFVDGSLEGLQPTLPTEAQ